MREILSIVKELQSDSTKTGKVAILNKHKDHKTWKQFLKYVLDEQYIYGIQNKKLNKFAGKTDGNTMFCHLFDVFDYLLKNNTGADITVEMVAKFIDAEADTELKELYTKSLTKSLKMGIDSTVNRVYGKGFLSEFKVMLAKDFYKESHKVEGEEFFLTEKLDGMRLIAKVENGSVKFYSRKGQIVDELVELEDEVSQLPSGVYDGEILIKNEHLYSDRDVLQETLKIAKKKGEKTGLNFWLFDSLSLEEFESGESELLYSKRRDELELLLTDTTFEHIKLLPILYEGKDVSVIPDLLKTLEDEGKEGLMLNRDMKYSCKRTDALLKIKTMLSFDEYVIDVFEGEGRLEGKLGGIIVSYKGYPLRCGSGFTDDERVKYWNSPESIKGELVEIQYFRESTNANGGLSVSFPVFKCVRTDKKETSYN